MTKGRSAVKFSRGGLISVGIYAAYALLLVAAALLIFDGMTTHILMELSTIPGGLAVGAVLDFVVQHSPPGHDLAISLGLSIASYLLSIVIAYFIGWAVEKINLGVASALDRLDERFIDRIRRGNR